MTVYLRLLTAALALCAVASDSSVSVRATAPPQVQANLRPAQVHASHRYDPQNDRVVYGGYSYAAPFSAPSASELRAEESSEARTLYARDLAEVKERVLFREEEGSIARFEVSASGTLAVLSVLRKSHDQLTSRVPVVLRILDASGNRILPPVASVRDFAWAPTGTRIAYTTGEPTSSNEDFRMTGTWVLDVESGETTTILDSGRHVAWAEHDGKLYVYGAPRSVLEQSTVWRYDPRTGGVEEVPHRGIHFSPSGDFYFKETTTNAPGYGLYETATHRALLAEPGPGAERSSLAPLVPQLVRWLPDRDVLVFESAYYGDPGVARPVHTMLYDPRSDVVIDLGESAIVGFDRSANAIRWDGAAFERRPSEELLAGPMWRRPR